MSKYLKARTRSLRRVEVRRPTYDMNRNLATYDGWSYTYNSMNRLTSATTTGTSAYFYYDGLNRQVAPYVSSNPVTFSVWDGWNFYAEYSPGNVLSDTLTYRRVATWLSMARAPL